MSTSATSSSVGTASFTGQSSFSTDLQSVITRAVNIASLPITQLQNNQTTLTSQQGELQTLGNDFQNLQSALDAINSSTGSSSYTASSDTPAVATATLSSGALAGSYSVNVTAIGSKTNALSAAGATAVTDPSSTSISSSSNFTLTVDGKSYTLTPAASNLNSLVSAINSSGAKVQATVVNVGGSSAPDYRLSVQSSQYAPDTIQLSDGTNTSILNTLSTGSYVSYQVNGQTSNTVTSDSRSLSISTGLAVNVLATGTANITVAQGSASIASALSSLTTSYNTVVDELTKNRGQNGGALAGQSTISTLSSALQQIAGYGSTSTGSVSTISDLGLTFDTNGHLQFDQSQFYSAASSSLNNVIGFLGSETTGGFLKTAYSTLTSITDATNGIITDASNSIGASIESITSQISAKQDQITTLQTNLTQEMAQADSTISSLESQVNEITNLFAAQTQAQKNITG